MAYIIFIILTFYFAVVIRAVGLGMSFRKALICSFTYPIDIVIFHFKLSVQRKNITLSQRIKLLVAPFLNVPETIVTYAKVDMIMSDRHNAITRLLSQLTPEQQVKLLNGLEADGIIEKKNPRNFLKKDSIITTNSGIYEIKKNSEDLLKGV